MTGTKSRHIPVLLREVVDALRASQGGLFLDCTFGGGGHSTAILESSPSSSVVGLDRDRRAIERAAPLRARFEERLALHRVSFGEVRGVVGELRFDGVLADLGMSTDQLHEGRGFSFSDDGSLDMRMDDGSGVAAGEFLNSASERELFLALAEGGVGKQARQVAALLTRERPFESARQLAETLRHSALGKRGEGRSHPATVVFQALRMYVNREREQIASLLDSVPFIVRARARLAVITFHSIEDELVAGTMRRWESSGSYPASWRGSRDEKKLGVVVTKKPIIPSEEEVSLNPASRSARLRVFQFE